MALGFCLVLSPSNFFHASYSEIFPKTTPSTLFNPNILSKLIKSIFGFYSNYFSFQNNSVFSFESR